MPPSFLSDWLVLTCGMQRPCRRFPEPGRYFRRCRHHQLAVRREGHDKDRILMAFERASRHPIRRVWELGFVISGYRCSSLLLFCSIMEVFASGVHVVRWFCRWVMTENFSCNYTGFTKTFVSRVSLQSSVRLMPLFRGFKRSDCGTESTSKSFY